MNGMGSENIARINELSRIARERNLTEEEAAERHERRQAYLQAFRAQMRGQLENTLVQYPDGSKVPFRDAAKKKN